MSLPQSVAEVIQNHVTLEVESIDRMYLNVYQPKLQYGSGAAAFFRRHRGEAFATARVMSRMTRAFVAGVESFVKQNNLPLVTFEKGVRKDEVAQQHLARFAHEEGVVFVGKAQEKVPVWRTETRTNPDSGRTYPWLYKSTAMVNQFYFYCVDKNFGPFFLKFCSYFPYTAKLCLNGHEYAKRQLDGRGIGYEPLDNGVAACDDPAALQKICDGLSEYKIDRLLRKWLRRLPHPFTDDDRRAGFRYDVSILQSEFSLTQVFDRPQSGRMFFERVLRDSLDLGRPDKMQLIFDRRIPKTTKTRRRTRLINARVTPSLWIDYKSSSLKQYFKQCRALRTETTVNHTRDFGIGRRLENLSRLREVAFAANRRLLHVQQIQHDPATSQAVFDTLIRPFQVDGQRSSGLRFGDEMVLAIFTALLMYRILIRPFRNGDLRAQVAQLLGYRVHEITAGQMTYQLRRLRLRGFIRRLPRSNRYEVTEEGLRTALFYTTSLSQVIHPTQTAMENDSVQQKLLKQLRKYFHATEQKTAA